MYARWRVQARALSWKPKRRGSGLASSRWQQAGSASKPCWRTAHTSSQTPGLQATHARQRIFASRPHAASACRRASLRPKRHGASPTTASPVLQQCVVRCSDATEHVQAHHSGCGRRQPRTSWRPGGAAGTQLHGRAALRTPDIPSPDCPAPSPTGRGCGAGRPAAGVCRRAGAEGATSEDKCRAPQCFHPRVPLATQVSLLTDLARDIKVQDEVYEKARATLRKCAAAWGSPLLRPHSWTGA